MSVTLETGDGRSTLRFERLLSHDRARVWRAVTDPGELGQWFPTAVIYEPRVGAPMQFDFGGEHGLDVWPGEVLEWDPPRVFAFSWSEDVLRFELSDATDGTRLVFTHSFAHQPGKPARDGAGWLACLDAFDALLAGGEPATGDWRAHMEAQVSRLGPLSLDGPAGPLAVRLTGPYMEVGGRPAVNADVGGEAGVLVVRDAGRALEDGVELEVRDGSVDAPGDLRLTGVLRDPLAARR